MAQRTRSTERTDDVRTMQDPASGYASADTLDPDAPMNQDHSGERPGQEERDPGSGYSSADLLGPRRATRPARTAAHPDPVQDPMAGYASADVLD